MRTRFDWIFVRARQENEFSKTTTTVTWGGFQEIIAFYYRLARMLHPNRVVSHAVLQACRIIMR